MKKAFAALAFTALILTGQAFAASITVSPQAQYMTALTVATESNMALNVGRTPGVLSYSDAGVGWALSTKAGLKITGDPSTSLLVTVPATVNLTSSTKTATLSVTGRCDQGGYAANKSGGADCASASTGTDGIIYLAVFPTSLSLGQDAGASYTGSLTVTVDYP